MSTMLQRVRVKGENRYAQARPNSTNIEKVAFVSWQIIQTASRSVLPLLHDLLHVSLPLRNHDLSSAVPAVGLDASGAPQILYRALTVSLHCICRILLPLSLVTVSRKPSSMSHDKAVLQADHHG